MEAAGHRVRVVGGDQPEVLLAAADDRQQRPEEALGGAEVGGVEGDVVEHSGYLRRHGHATPGGVASLPPWPSPPSAPAGELLREWRERRRLSQLELALEADISTRHLSFVETGRSQPSREMVLRLAEQLDVPLRERNQLLLAAGYAPVYAERALDGAGDGVRADGGAAGAGRPRAVPRVVVVDRAWNLVDANASIGLFTAGRRAGTARPPVNVLREACTRTGWRRGSSTSASGGRTCSAGCGARSP